MAPVFQEVVWNEYCVLFPDGSSAPFNEAVRYSALTGYLRKKEVVSDGRAEFAIAHGESQRGWVRHFVHLSTKQLAWFDEDPQEAIDRQRATTLARDWRVRMTSALRRFKREHSRGKGVGSALFNMAPCRLYTSRLYRNEFALSFGNGQLLTLQAADGADAQTWLVALASCLFFSSEAFDAALGDGDLQRRGAVGVCEADRGGGKTLIYVRDHDALVEQAMAAFQAEHWADAVRLYDILLKEFPNTPGLGAIAHNCGLALQNMGMHKEAAGRFAMARKQHAGTFACCAPRLAGRRTAR